MQFGLKPFGSLWACELSHSLLWLRRQGQAKAENAELSLAACADSTLSEAAGRKMAEDGLEVAHDDAKVNQYQRHVSWTLGYKLNGIQDIPDRPA